MGSLRTTRRERQRQRERAEERARRRGQYLLYGLVCLAGPFVGLLYGGLPAVGIGTVVSLLLAAYFFRAARSEVRGVGRRLRKSVQTEPGSASEYERSLEQRLRSGRPNS